MSEPRSYWWVEGYAEFISQRPAGWLAPPDGCDDESEWYAGQAAAEDNALIYGNPGAKAPLGVLVVRSTRRPWMPGASGGRSRPVTNETPVVTKVTLEKLENYWCEFYSGFLCDLAAALGVEAGLEYRRARVNRA